MQPIVNMPEEDRVTDIGNVHKKFLIKIMRMVLAISLRTDRHTDRYTHHNTSQPLPQTK